jgi:Ca2+-binding RTX toxin-like protein
MPTIAANTTALVNFGNSTTVVAPGVIVSDLGATSSQGNSILVNYGSIITQFAGSVLFSTGSSGRLYNEADGLIVGLSGVDITDGGGVTIRNRGDIIGVRDHGIHVRGAGNNVTITNTGEIDGTLGGVTVSAGAATNVRITNSGEIHSEQNGIWLLNANGAPVIVNSGIVSGDVNAILAASGDRLDLTNTGQLIGHVRATSSNQTDTVVNNGTVTGSVFLGSGNDSYTGTGSVSVIIAGEAGSDTLSGGNSGDRLLGGTENDLLFGNGGNDTLVGNSGKDTMTGGAGNDRFWIAVAADSPVGAAADVITDFDDFGDDQIDVSGLFGPAMTYRHNLAFTAAGQVRINDIAGPDLLVEVNTGGTLAADAQIRLTNTILASMSASDFIL